jgi:hypothetical protein
LEDVKAGTDQVFDGDEDTRQRMNFSFLKMGGLSEHEAGRTLLIVRSSHVFLQGGGLSNQAEDADFVNR